MNYTRKFHARTQKPVVLKPDFLVQQYQTLAVMASKISMAILSDLSSDDLKKLAYDYNSAYQAVLNSSGTNYD